MFPPRAILAAVDFSAPSRAALTYAARLAKHVDAQLRVLHAEDPLLAAAASTAGIDLAAEAREELLQFVQSAAPAGDWAPMHHVVSGPAVDVICDIATREQVDLIVIGARGMSGAERRMFGSTTEGVLRNAEHSVLVVPANWRPPRMHAVDLSGTGPIIAAVDLSAPSLEAARAACDIAAMLGASLEAVHIVRALPVPARWSVHADQALRERTESARREVTQALRCTRTASPIAVRIETGPVAECLAAAATKPGQHPLLVLGRRTRSDRKGAPGSIAYRVLTLAEVPLLLHVPAD